MTEESWVPVISVPGRPEAELVQSMLEAYGVQPVYLSQEALGSVYGLTIDTLGTVEVMVPASQVETARPIIEDYLAAMGAADADDAPDLPDDVIIA